MQLVSLKVMAQMLGVTPRTLQGYVKRLDLPHYRIGKYPRFDPEKVLERLAVEQPAIKARPTQARRAPSARGTGRFAGLLG